MLNNGYFKELDEIFNKTSNDFMKIINERYEKEEIEFIKKAYSVASCYHALQKRKSGEAYFTHPLNVAYFFAYYNFDYETVVAGLLHDVIEDTTYEKKELLNDFGNNIYNMVIGVTKLKKNLIINDSLSKKLTHRRIINNITKDERTIIVKLVDRLHNMYTLDSLSRDKIRSISLETNDFYVNLARILGIYHLKDHLEDLSLYYLDNDKFLKYNEIREKIKQDNLENNLFMANEVKEKMKENNINISYILKQKNIAGICNEMLIKNDLDLINDLNAIKILTDSKEDCYRAFFEIKSLYKVKKGTLKDYIYCPKYNGYSSINFNILSNNTQFRIRTNNMEKTNNLGLVSSWDKNKQLYLNEKFKEIEKENKKELLIRRKKI